MVSGKAYEELRSPYSQEVIGEIPIASPEEVEEAITCAQNSVKVMRNLTAYERAEILERVADLITERHDECALILASESAKPLKAAKAEITRTAETYKFAGEASFMEKSYPWMQQREEKGDLVIRSVNL